MPIYEYECQTCEHQFEILLRHDEQAECPQCQGEQLHKLISAHAIGTGLTDTPCGKPPSPMCGGGGCGSCE